jgi:HAD superfamily hydrolase (TIGR01509 family)
LDTDPGLATSAELGEEHRLRWTGWLWKPGLMTHDGAERTSAVVFDYDGLMVDSESVAARVLLDHLSRLGATVDLEAVGHLFGGTGPAMDLIWESFLRQTLGEVDLPTVMAELDELILAAGMGNPLLPGVTDLIDAAHDLGWAVGLGTGRLRRHLDPELARHGLGDAFDAIVTAEDVARGKPAPDIYLAVADRLGVSPSDCLVLEDSLHGCVAGLAAGMTVVVCPSPATAGCDFPTDARRVGTLAEVSLAEMASRAR